jgi:hypothetical protein
VRSKRLTPQSRSSTGLSDVRGDGCACSSPYRHCKSSQADRGLQVVWNQLILTLALVKDLHLDFPPSRTLVVSIRPRSWVWLCPRRRGSRIDCRCGSVIDRALSHRLCSSGVRQASIPCRCCPDFRSHLLENIQAGGLVPESLLLPVSGGDKSGFAPPNSHATNGLSCSIPATSGSAGAISGTCGKETAHICLAFCSRHARTVSQPLGEHEYPLICAPLPTSSSHTHISISNSESISGIIPRLAELLLFQ